MAVIPAPWQAQEPEHPDASSDRPGRYPHTGRGFFSGALVLTNCSSRRILC